MLTGSGFTMRGLVAELRLGYKVVATFGAWTLSVDRVELTPIDVQEFYLDDGVLDLRLTVGQKQWIWHGVSLIDRGTPFVIRLEGSPEVR